MKKTTAEYFKYGSYKKKLQNICEENDLIFRFSHESYPITLTVSPNPEKADQIGMAEVIGGDEYPDSPNASLVFAFIDGSLTYRMSETFTIGDALFSKIKNLYKNMHSLWLQFFFREVIEKIEKGALTIRDFPSITANDSEFDSDPLENACDGGGDGDEEGGGDD
jgi:hypothetical protein